MATVILGTGIIGVSTAYYLSQMVSPSTIHLVEASPTLFASASGYAGGFLAKDWFSQPVTDLGALSFQEHKKLAEAYDGGEKWGYSRSQGASYTTAEGSSTTGRERGDEWLRQGGSRANAAAEGMSVFIDDEDNEEGIEGELAWLRRIKGSRVEIISEEGSLAQV
jgi:glycine/D-amino acid oxidase-like deaminating enzyme